MRTSSAPSGNAAWMVTKDFAPISNSRGSVAVVFVFSDHDRFSGASP